MARIKVVRGSCGITYTDRNGALRHACKTAGSGPFECDDAQAERFVSLGVAEYVTDQNERAGSGQGAGTARGNGKATVPFNAAVLEARDYNELKKLAAEMGAEPKGRKKADLIAAITAAEADADAEEADKLPKLGAADPE